MRIGSGVQTLALPIYCGLALVVVLHDRVGEFVDAAGNFVALGLVHRVGVLGAGGHVGDLAFVACTADGNAVVAIGIRSRAKGNRIVARGLAARADRDRALGVRQRVGTDGNGVDLVTERLVAHGHAVILVGEGTATQRR